MSTRESGILATMRVSVERARSVEDADVSGQSIARCVQCLAALLGRPRKRVWKW